MRTRHGVMVMVRVRLRVRVRRNAKALRSAGQKVGKLEVLWRAKKQ